MTQLSKERNLHHEERKAPFVSGMPILCLNILAMIGGVLVVIFASSAMANQGYTTAWQLFLAIFSGVYVALIGPVLFMGLKILKPNEALVLTLFGKYYGTLKGEGFFFVHPFVSGVNPVAEKNLQSKTTAATTEEKAQVAVAYGKKTLSLKAVTLNNDRQKINDLLGNPIIIGIVVIWRVVNTAKAVFNVDNYVEYLSMQCDSALRNIVRNYAYDSAADDSEMTLRGSSQEIADKLCAEIQTKVEVAGLEILEARITNLSYAPEIAAAMLQRQQASAIIDARQMIVEGAVGMVEMALAKLSENDTIHLDEERKAAMVSNLLVVLCGNKDAQPIVNSGSLY